ncbi:hypothetical protein CCMA1212_006907 [Trichoderma ghanense]|uniref:Uncharacterized protein n=1 Tax=Trichoderma ghanense TaxID=65468 RepID=A0ABY2GZ55_9HYPO
MVQTRAQRAAKRRHTSEPEDLEQDAPTSRPPAPERLGDAAVDEADPNDPIDYWI